MDNYTPYFYRYFGIFKKKIFYEVSFYCNENKIIHSNLKEKNNCKQCNKN
jgi:hypothetical protein